MNEKNWTYVLLTETILFLTGNAIKKDSDDRMIVVRDHRRPGPIIGC
jgi:hypothetical protein